MIQVFPAAIFPRTENQERTGLLGTATGEDVASHKVELGRGANERPALKALFGVRRVLGLEYLINSGYPVDEIKVQLAHLQYDADQVLGDEVVSAKVYAENVREDARKALRSLLVREALEYGLASAETAFVAVRKERGKPVEGTVPVANALPVGWSGDFLAVAGMAAYSLRSPSLGTGLPSDLSIPAFLRRRTPKSAADAGTVAHLASMGLAFAEAGEPAEPTVIFSGVPPFVGNEAVLFDSSRPEDADTLPESATIRLIQVRLPEKKLDPSSLDPGLELVIFVGDLASPRATVRLLDIVRRRGQRPLNVAKDKADAVRIVLADPASAWSQTAPKLEVALAW